MTTTLQPAAPAVPSTGGRATARGAARRALVRWAWRLFRREWRQQLLVLALLSLAVMATTAGVTVATNTAAVEETKLTLPGSDNQLDADIAALQQQFGALDVVRHRQVHVPGSIANVDVQSHGTNGVQPTLRLVSGRFPDGPGEVAMTRAAAATFDLHIGDAWPYDGRSLRLVGLVENPRNLDDRFVLVPPGQINEPDSVSVILPRGADPQSIRLPSQAPRFIERVSPTAKAAAAAAVLALETIGLLFVGLVAVAGFTVMAQRRLRALGMLRSLGATDRHVRLVLLANGAIVGVVASAVGAAAGLALWLSFEPKLETLSSHRIDRFALPWWAIGMALLLAVITSVAAAWWPARAASRVSVMAALSNRPPRPRPAHRFAALGAVLVLAGLAALVAAREKRPLFIVGGEIAVTVGVLLLAPLAVRVLGVFAHRVPIAARLALRDLVRYQARSAAALGAITLAVGIAAATATSAAYQVGKESGSAGNLPANALVVHLSARPGGGPLPDLSPADLDAIRTRVDAMAAALPTKDLTELDRAVNPDAPQVPGFGKGSEEPAALVRETPDGDRTGLSFVAPLYVATPAVLARFGIKPEQIDPTADIISSSTDLSGLRVFIGVRETLDPKVQRVMLPKYSSEPSTLLTTHAVQRSGLRVVPASWLLQTAHPLTSAQIATARKAAADGGFEIETRETHASLTRLGDVMTAAGIVLALGVLALTVGLIRSETANDLRTLAATGASTRTRRSVTGVTAGALAVLGGVLGTVGAYVALIAWHHSHLHPLGHVPVNDLAAILVGLPLVAAAGGWLFAGREPTALGRRPLE